METVAAIDHATLNRQVMFGESNGKIIWQPRIGCWYQDKMFEDGQLPAPYTGMSLHDIYRNLGCSARLYDFIHCFRKIEDPRITRETRQINSADTETIVTTPVGTQRFVVHESPNSWYKKKIKYWVETEEELKVLIWRHEHTEWVWDQEKFESMVQEFGDLGAPIVWTGRFGLQELLIDQMGIEKGIYAIFEMPDTVEAFLRASDIMHDRLLDVLVDCPVEIISLPSCLHGHTLSPDLFVKYHLPGYQWRCEKLHKAGKKVHSHWDGMVKPLLGYAQESGLDGLEALTPEPQGDMTLEDIKEALGDNMILVDGIPAVYFDETYPLQTLIDSTKKIIDMFAPNLVLGISDEISSHGDIERIRVVGDIVDEYNAAIA